MAPEKDAILRDLTALMKIPSFTVDIPMAHKALHWVLKRAAEMGFRTGITPEGDAGWAEIGEGRVTLGVLAHVDVVGIGDRSKWICEPCSLTEINGRLYGRGVEDDKGPLIQCLYAAKHVLDKCDKINKRIRLIFGTSEEMEWTDMAHYCEHFGVPDYGFSPDAAFPIYNVENGYADVELVFNCDGISELSSGDSANTIPSRAYLRKSDGREYLYNGISAHSSIPASGDNAIVGLAGLVSELSFARFVCDMFDGDYNGIRVGIDDGSDTFNGMYTDKTVCSPTVLSLKDGSVFMNINIRIRYGVDSEQILASFERHSKKYGYSFHLVESTAPMLVDPNQRFISAMNSVLEEAGVQSGCIAAPGSSYCGTIPNHVGFGPVIPPDEGSAHIENESWDLNDFWRVYQIYEDYLMLEAGEES